MEFASTTAFVHAMQLTWAQLVTFQNAPTIARIRMEIATTSDIDAFVRKIMQASIVNRNHRTDIGRLLTPTQDFLPRRAVRRMEVPFMEIRCS
jgi:hypothetical protein